MKMKLIFTALVFIYTSAQTYGCRPAWYNKCKSNRDCCSGNCLKEGVWEYGVCQPGRAASGRSNTCHPNWYNKCTNDDQCCSGFCEKEGNWQYGICKQSKEPDSEPGPKPGGRDSSSFEDCGIAPSRPRTMIYNGKESEIGEFPWHVGIYEERSGKFVQVCGGSLISKKIVISAAHCFTTDNLENRKIYIKSLSTLRVGLGKHYRDIDAPEDSSSRQIKEINSVYIPKSYDGHRSQYEGDIAVVSLQTEVEYTKRVRPACIDIGGNSFEKRQLVKGTLGKVVGWGLTEMKVSSERLMLAKMPYVSMEECKEKIGENWLSYLKEEKICAGAEKLDSTICQGDSGGGLVFLEQNRRKFYLRGIVSLGVCDGVEGFALFTRLSSYKEFVGNYV